MRPGMGRSRFEKKAKKANNVKATLLRLITYMTDKWLMLMVVFIVLITSLLSITGPYILGKAVDDYLYVGRLEGFSTLIIILAGVYISNAFFTWLASYIVVKISQSTVMRIRKDLFRKLQLLPIKFFDNSSDGDLMSRLTNDVDNISTTLNQNLTQIVSSTVTFVGVLIMMIILDIRLMFISSLSIPFVIILTQSLSKFTRKYFREKMTHLGDLNSFIEETISGQKVILAYGQEDNMTSDFIEKNNHYKKATIKAETLTSIMGPTMNFTNNMIYAFLSLAGGLMVINQMTTVGTVVIFLSYSRQLARPINQIATLYNTIQSAIAGAERVFEVIDKEEENLIGHERELKGQVVLKDVNFSYEEGQKVLKDIQMHAGVGEMVAIVGPTGAGKTTIINLLTRFYDIDSGQILIDGHHIEHSNLDYMRSQLGIVLQDTYLFTGTVMENIKYGKPEATDEEVIKASKLSSAHHFIHRLPNGYDTVLGGEGFGISQGQRQMIAIARAILADPKILILDEATSSVDTRTEKMLQEGLQNLMKGRTSFVIAHRLSTIKAADKIYVIEDGRIIEEGNHEELMTSEGHYHEMYTSQFKAS